MASSLRYLSLHWIEAIAQHVTADVELQKIGHQLAIGITQVVTDGPGGTVVYHLQVGNGTVTFSTGPADPETVRLEQDWETAVAVATGAMTAEDAFITGKIRLSGDAQMLLENQSVFAAMDPIFVVVANATNYN